MTFYCFYQKKYLHLKELKSNTMNTSSVTLLRFTFISLLFLMSSCLNEKDEARLKEWGKIYKEYTSNAEYKKYDYENASYKFVINKALSIIKDCRN